MILYIILFILWCTYMSFEGYREGAYFHYLYKAGGEYTDEHIEWTIQRLIVGIVFYLCAVFYDMNLIFTLALGFSLVLSSPFWHDGLYYWKRNELNPDIYKKGFWDNTTTPRGWITKICTPLLRTLYFILSIIIFVFYLTITS